MANQSKEIHVICSVAPGFNNCIFAIEQSQKTSILQIQRCDVSLFSYVIMYTALSIFNSNWNSCWNAFIASNMLYFYCSTLYNDNNVF